MTVDWLASILNHMVEDLADMDDVFHALSHEARRVEHVIHVGQILNHVVENTGEPVNRQPFG